MRMTTSFEGMELIQLEERRYYIAFASGKGLRDGRCSLLLCVQGIFAALPSTPKIG
jgi:hypothetical protein